MDPIDRAVRFEVYRSLADTGLAPDAAELAALAGGADAAAASLRRLHDAHALVLDGDGALRMALPFSAVATDHRVVSDGGTWWANCAWDSLAIPIALDIDATIQATWLDTAEPVGLAVVDGELTDPTGFIHFEIPARRWWDDIVET